MFVFRQFSKEYRDYLDETSQPVDKAANNLLAGLILTEEFVHVCLYILESGVVFAGGGLRGAHSGAARPVKDQPDRAFDAPGDEGVDQHGEQG